MRFFSALLALLLAACSPVKLLNAMVPSKGYRIVQDVPYGQNGRQKLDIYVPDGLTGNAPVIVFFYGGSWQTGTKNIYRFLGQSLASEGFVTVVADYRLYPEVAFPAFVEDSALAVRWVNRHIGEVGGDPDGLFLAGHSAGGLNAALLALDPHYLAEANVPASSIRGLIGLSGPYDFLPLTDDKLKQIFPEEIRQRSQALHFADGTFSGGKKPPVFLATSDDDTDVYPKNSRNLAKALTAAENEVETHEYHGLGHIRIILTLAYGFRNESSLRDDIAAFVRAHSR